MPHNALSLRGGQAIREPPLKPFRKSAEALTRPLQAVGADTVPVWDVIGNPDDGK